MAEWVTVSTIPNLFANAPSPAASGAPAINVGDPAPSFSEPTFGNVGAAETFGGGPSTMPQPARGRSSGGSAQEYLTFKKMITPIVIQIVFWVLVALCVIVGLFAILRGMAADSAMTMLVGLAQIVIGPLIIRIYCELLIVIFSINDTLLDIKGNLHRQNK